MHETTEPASAKIKYFLCWLHRPFINTYYNTSSWEAVQLLNIVALTIVFETKTDDASDQAAERTARAEKVLQGVKFSRPREITNPYLPLSNLKEDNLEGMEGGHKFRVERRAKPDIHKTFKIGVKLLAAYTFTLYLLHQPLFLFWGSVLRGDPKGYRNWALTTVLVALSVAVVGTVTENRRYLLTRWLRAWLEKVGARWRLWQHGRAA